MKTIKIISSLMLFGFLAAGISFAQEKSEKEKKAEAEKRAQHLEQQVQELLKENKVLQERDLQKILESTKKLQETEWETMIEDQSKVRDEALKNFERSQETWRRAGERGIIVSPPNVKFDYLPDNYFKVRGFADFSDANTLNISKELEDVTYSKDFPYEVSETAHSLSFSVSGELDEGEMSIVILKPDETNYQEIALSPLANVSWSQSLTWKEENSDEFAGTWKIRVKAKAASGNYQVSVRGR